MWLLKVIIAAIVVFIFSLLGYCLCRMSARSKGYLPGISEEGGD
jgi:hypothetical protein